MHTEKILMRLGCNAVSIFCVFQELGNNILENSKNSTVLQEILTSATIMVVSVTSSTTQGSVFIQ